MPTKNVPPYEIVRRSCAAFHSDRVHVDPVAAKAFADELNVPALQASASSLAYNSGSGLSCRFDSVNDEAAFVVLFHALDFGSGWRKQLHRHHQKGAFLTIQKGIDAFYNAHPKLLSNELLNTSKQEVAKAFSLEGNSELEDLVELLHQVIVHVGRQTLDYGSLTLFVTKKLQELSKTTPAGYLVWDLIETFPVAFDDVATVNGQRVCFYKKAQLVVGELYHRFRSEDSRFAFLDGNKLTAYIDNVVVATLRYKKVLVVCPELTDMIEHAGTELLAGSENEVALRAAACVGVEKVVSFSELTAMELDSYLWGDLGKVPEIRKFERHATKTIFY